MDLLEQADLENVVGGAVQVVKPVIAGIASVQRERAVQEGIPG